MKKLFLLFIAFAILALSACSNSRTPIEEITLSPSFNNEELVNTPDAEPSPMPDTADSSSGKFDSFEVMFKRAWLTEDYEGNVTLALAFDFTNLDPEKAQNFTFATHAKAFQDGVQLDKAIMVDDIDYGENQKDLKANATLEVYSAFVLSNTTSIVEIELTKLISFDDEKYTFEIDPSALG